MLTRLILSRDAIQLSWDPKQKHFSCCCAPCQCQGRHMPCKVLLKGAGMGQPCLWEPVFLWQGISLLVSRKSDVLQAIVNGPDTNGWLTVFGGAWIFPRCLQKGKGTCRLHFSSRS